MDLGGGGQNSTFSEHGHVAYQIRGNHECSNMVANILSADTFPPPPPLDPGGQKVKVKIFQNRVLLHIIWYVQSLYNFFFQSELAVHKKKLTEVESWIKEHITTSRKVKK